MPKPKTTKVDKSLLAQCIVHALDEHAKGDVKHYRKRLRDPVYFKRVMRSPIGAIYRTFKPTPFI